MIGRTKLEAATFISERWFPVSYRTLEKWRDLPFVVVNGRARYAEADLQAAAERRVRAAVERAARHAA